MSEKSDPALSSIKERIPTTYPYRVPVFIMVCGLLISSGLFFTLKQWEETNRYREFQYKAAGHTTAIRVELEHVREKLEFVSKLIEFHLDVEGDNPLDLNQFIPASEMSLLQDPDLMTFAWAVAEKGPPQTGESKRLKVVYVNKAHHIKEVRTTIHMGDYYDEYIGTDVVSTFDEMPALQAFIHDESHPKGNEINFIAPVYGHVLSDGNGNRERVGAVITEWNVVALIERALKKQPVSGLDASLFIVNDDDGSKENVYTHISRSRSDEEKDIHTCLRSSTSFDLYGQHWQLEFESAPQFLRNHPFIIAWESLFFGLLLTGLFAWYARHAVRQNHIIEKKVIKRTKQLERSKTNYRELIELSTEPICVHREGTWIYVNPAGVDFFGASRQEDILGKPVLNFVHPDYHDIVNERIDKQSEKNRTSARIEEKLLKFDGTAFEAEVVGMRTLYEGKPASMVIAHDITERKRNQYALTASEERFRELFEANRSVQLIINPESGRIIDANRAAEVYYGYDREQLLSLKISEINILTKQEIYAAMELAKIEKQNNFLFKHRLASGDIRDVEVHSGPIRWNQNTFLYSIIHDVTDRVEAEKTVQKLSQAIEQAHESVLITNKDGIIEYVNSAFTTLTGYSAEEAIGHSPRLLNSGKQSASFYEDMWQTISSGKIWQGKVIDRKKDGSLFPILLSISPILNDDGTIAHFVGAHSDLTQLESLEQQFHQAQKMEALGTLVGGIAHDFNNMLAGMTGNLYLAKKKAQENPDVLEKLANVERLSFRAADMIKQLLTFARKDQVSIKPLPLTPFFKDTLKFLRASISERIALRHNICKDSLTINGDATQLHQLLMNLVNNARDAVEEVDNPSIIVRLEPFQTDDTFMSSHRYFTVGNYAHLSVADNGYGIPEDQIEHLFEPFFTTKEQGKGTGLGLAMVFGVVKTHHGFVEVESIEGKGSTFHIYLPLLKAEEMADASLSNEGIVEGSGETILLVDDEQDMIETGKEVLESLNYRVLQASNGLEAVEVFAEHQNKISLIIMDVVMPGIGGIKAAGRIRKISPDIKVIFATGYDKDSTLQGNMPSSENITLAKPYNIQELSKSIRDQLDA